MLILDTTKAELKSKWKQMYRDRKEFETLDVSFWRGYYTGKMEYTAWLILNAREGGSNDRQQINSTH